MLYQVIEVLLLVNLLYYINIDPHTQLQDEMFLDEDDKLRRPRN